MRGEKIKAFPDSRTWTGSPPRARGKDEYYSINLAEEGITPACAGKSLRLTVLSDICKDHPRVRGEKLIVRSEGLNEAGSPPRARGKVGNAHLIAQHFGITPACAGKSLGVVIE